MNEHPQETVLELGQLSIGQVDSEIVGLGPGPDLSGQVCRTGAGRPTVVDEEVKSKVCLLLSLGLSRRQAAAYVQIVPSTIANAIERDPQFAQDVERAEQMSVVKPIVTIAAAGQKNWRAAVWLLERNERLPVSEEEQRERVEEARKSALSRERY